MQISVRTTGLKLEPTMVVGSLPELFGLARRLAADAVELYRTLSARMGDIGNESARIAFAAIEMEKRRHAEALERRLPPELRGPPEPAARWTDLSVFDNEDLERSRLVTPYLALAVAVRNEERAFQFWSYIRANADNPEVSAEAERLALEELDHVTELRAARRRAYRQDQRADAERLDRLRKASHDEFVAEAARRESELAILHAAIARELERLGDPRAPRLAALAEEERASSRSLRPGETEASSGPLLSSNDPTALWFGAVQALEGAVELYLSVAESSADEDVMTDSQRLSQAAVERLVNLSRP